MSENERAPMCRICGHRHWSREPHNFGKSKPPAPDELIKKGWPKKKATKKKPAAKKAKKKPARKKR